MTVKLNIAAGNQYFSAPDNPSFTIPAGDFTIGWIAHYDGATSGNAQYIISTGNFQEAGSFNITYQPSGNPIANRLAVYAGTGSNPVLASSAGNQIAAGDTWLHVLRRTNGVLKLSRCPILSVAPIDGSAVQADGSVSSSLAYDGTRGLTIGGRADKATSRLFDHSIGRPFCVPESITDFEIARLAYGEDIIAQLGKTVSWYVRLDTADDFADRGPNSNVFTASGSPQTSAVQPAFGYVPAETAPVITTAPVIDEPVIVGQQATYKPGTVTGSPTPTKSQQWLLNGVEVGTSFTPSAADAGKSLAVDQIATSSAGTAKLRSSAVTIQAQATNSVTVVSFKSNRIVQRGYAVPVAFTYEGDTPTSAEYALYAENGATIVQNWTALADAMIGSGIGLADALLPSGGPYRIAVRLRYSGGGLVTSAVASDLFFVGGLGAALGSSSAERLFANWSGSGFTPDAFTRRLDKSTLTWLPMSTNGAATVLAANLRQQSGVPIGLLPCGVGGTRLTDWLDTNGTEWKAFLALLAEAGGKLEFAYVTVGSNDATNSTWASPNEHFNRMKQFVSNIRAATGQPNLPILWSGSNRRTDLKDTQADYLRSAENLIGDEPNVYHVQTIDLPIRTDDGVHLTSSGFQASADRTNYVLGRKLYGDGVYARGPLIGSGLFSADTVSVPVSFRNGSANSITPAANFTGFSLTDASGTPAVLSRSVVSGRPTIKYDRALVAPVSMSFLSGTSPDVSAVLFDNGPTPLPATVNTSVLMTESTVTPPADTTAPSYAAGAVISITNPTNNGATITSPVATDNVAVAGYEYSINGGNSYSNLGNTRTATLTGLPSSTQYSVMFRAYDAAGYRSQPLVGSFTTLSATPTPDPQPQTPAFMRSKQRTIIIKAAPGKFSREGDFWKLDGARKPLGSIDPNSTIDITFNWTEVLADIQDTISNVQFDIIGLINKGSATQGAFATIFVGNATANPSITCRITTGSTPPRVEDRTVYLTVEQQ